MTPSAGLVYHAGGLGDFVLSLPAIFRVTQAHPTVTWRYWGPPDRLALLPGFDPAPPDLLRFGHTLWGDGPAPEARAALAGCRTVLAFGGRAAPEWVAAGAGQVLIVTSFPPAGGAWVPLHQARQLDAQAVPRAREPWIPAWRARVRPPGEPSWVTLHPGSGDLRKNLPAATWAEIAGRVAGATGRKVQLVLGPVEVERGGQEALTGAADRVVRCDDLGELLCVLAETELYLGNDAGTSHLAALLGIPTVVVFGPSDPTLWRPLGPRVRVVRAGAPCAPCTAGEAIGCLEPRCLTGLGPEPVVREAVDLLRPLRERPLGRSGPAPSDGAGEA